MYRLATRLFVLSLRPGSSPDFGNKLHPSDSSFQIGRELTIQQLSGECFYCNIGASCRCVRSKLLGSPGLDGAQAEYIRIPDADGSVVKAPKEINDKALVLMADIFPTGFFGATNAFNAIGTQPPSEVTAVVIGCGPVGLCAIVSALEYKPKHLFAIDGVDSRLELAKGLGAEPLNFVKDRQAVIDRIKEVTDGRGADIVIEVVGLSPALRTAYDVLRPFGFISSIGVHNAEVRSLSLLESATVALTLSTDPLGRK